MKFGYARVSTREQNLDLQLDAFKEKGCDRVYKEKVSGLKKERPELLRLTETLRQGDEVYVWALDRLGRSIYEVIHTISQINEIGARLIIITQNIDTTSPTGKIFVTVFALLAEMETELRKQRQLAGIEAAKARGIKLGRKKGLSPEGLKKANEVKKLYLSRDPAYSVREICSMIGLSTRTIYKYLDILEVPRRE